MFTYDKDLIYFTRYNTGSIEVLCMVVFDRVKLKQYKVLTIKLLQFWNSALFMKH